MTNNLENIQGEAKPLVNFQQEVKEFSIFILRTIKDEDLQIPTNVKSCFLPILQKQQEVYGRWMLCIRIDASLYDRFMINNMWWYDMKTIMGQKHLRFMYFLDIHVIHKLELMQEQRQELFMKIYNNYFNAYLAKHLKTIDEICAE